MRGRVPNRAARLLTLGAAIPLGGCLAGPNYVRPETPQPPAWHAQLVNGMTDAQSDRDALASWWSVLDDPLLSELVSRAIASNLDVEVARERVHEAHERRIFAEAGLYPSVRARSTATPQQGYHGRTPSTGIEALWTLDVAGRQRRTIEAAQGDQQAREEDLHDALVSVAAEVVQAYVDLRAVQAHLEIADANVDAEREVAQLANWRAQVGLTSSLDVVRADTDLEQTRAQLPSLYAGVEEAENRLALLLGETPGTFNDRLEAAKPLPTVPPEVAVGVPADALQRRPDVRRAERVLAAETARIGVAKAQEYPTISLTGAVGANAISPTTFASFTTPAAAAAAAATVSQVLFDHGAIRATIRGQQAVRTEARDRFQQVVLVALDDVENAMVEYGREQERLRGLVEASASAKDAAALSRERYASGLADFEVVLDSERSFYAIEEQRVASQARVVSDLVHLYRALGGGWSGEAQA
ncbi:MAG TPA: efflux transporter outer membrane subunit [Myxococcota bacterium]|nr:efflux transporter outer membrane subunit [Myxococcota bacterium]